MARLYVTKRLPDHLLQPIGNHDLHVWEGDGPVPRSELIDHVAVADGLLSMLTDAIDTEVIDASSRLRVISQMAVGVDNIDLEACRRKKIVVGHTPGVLTETVADHAFALLGAIVRRLPEGSAEVKSGEWGDWEPFHLAGGDLHGTTLGIVGMGRIGRAIARRARGFEMDVLYTSAGSTSDVGTRVDLDALMARADHVIVSASLNPSTRGLIGVDQLSLMKPSAYLVNVSRGPLIDTDALEAALRSGVIAGAALDVTDPEPIPPDHPLVALPNCLIVPHIASASVSTRNRMASLAVENLLAGVEGQPLPHAVHDGL